MKTPVRVFIVFVAALVAGAGAYFWQKSVRDEQQSFQVFTVARNLVAQSTVIQESDLRVASFPEAYRSTMGASVVEVTSANRAAFVGRTVSQDVQRGALLLFDHIGVQLEDDFSTKLAKGRRALTISVNAPSTVAYFVEPGSLVDILGTVVEPQSQTGGAVVAQNLRLVTKTFMQSVRVLAVGQARNPSEYQRTARSGYGTVTLDLSPLQAEQIVFASQQVQSGLTLVLRNPEDTQQVAVPSLDWRAWQDILDGKAGETSQTETVPQE